MFCYCFCKLANQESFLSAWSINKVCKCLLSVSWFSLIDRFSTRRVAMSFEIGKVCEGLHDGRWFICTILSQEDEGYNVTFKDWSSRFNTVLTADCIRPTSPAIDCRKRKRQCEAPPVNFSKLLPEDTVYVDVHGTKKPAIVRIIDPFLEILTVEIEGNEVMAPFASVLPRDEEPAVRTAKKQRKPVTSCPRESSPATASLPPATNSQESFLPPQFVSIVRPDGVEVSCGSLVTFVPTCSDLAFLVTEIFFKDSREMLKAQKCELSENTTSKLTEDFIVTCPVTSVSKLDLKTSNALTKTALEVRGRAVIRCAESLRHYAGNHAYQLRNRQHDLTARIREEVKKTMTAKAARTSTIKLGPSSLSTDLELLSLNMENGFKTTKSKADLTDWDVKIKPDERFFYVTFAEFTLDVSSRSLAMKVKFAESTCAFHPDSYRTDTDADCSWTRLQQGSKSQWPTKQNNNTKKTTFPLPQSNNWTNSSQ